MRRHLLFYQWLTFFLPLGLHAFNCLPPGNYNFDIQQDGYRRYYLLHVPRIINKEGPPPSIVFMLHTAGGDAVTASKRYGWEELAEEKGFLTVFPQALPMFPTLPSTFLLNPTLWRDRSGLTSKRHKVDDVAFLKAILKDVQRICSYDTRRVYFTGFSNGGSMTFLAGLEMSDQIAAIAPVSGHLWMDNPQTKRPMSMLLIVGEDDPFNPIEEALLKKYWADGIREIKPPLTNEVKTWLKLIGLSPVPSWIQANPEALITRFGPGLGGEEVIYIIVKSHGHEWPGALNNSQRTLSGQETSFNSTRTIWWFFQHHSLP